MIGSIAYVSSYNIIMLCIIIYQICINQVNSKWLLKFCIFQIPLVMLNSIIASIFS
jgi:hypothetical protein